MAEYINRERARFEAKRYFKNLDEIQEDLDMIFCMLPSADVAPVRHGRWEYDGPTINTYGMVKCTVCNWWTIDHSVSTVYHYCPNCGAKMDAIK